MVRFLASLLLVLALSNAAQALEPRRFSLAVEEGAAPHIVAAANAFAEQLGTKSGDAWRVEIAEAAPGTADGLLARAEVDFAIVPLDRYVEKVHASDLLALPGLFPSIADRDRILAPKSRFRVAFDTVTVNFGARILVLVPNGTLGTAFNLRPIPGLSGDDPPPVRAVGAAKSGIALAAGGRPVEGGEHAIAIVAAADMGAEYSVFEPVGAGLSVFIIAMSEPRWATLDDEEETVIANIVEEVSSRLSSFEAVDEAALDRLRARGISVGFVPDSKRRMRDDELPGPSRRHFLERAGSLGKAYLGVVDKMIGR